MFKVCSLSSKLCVLCSEHGVGKSIMEMIRRKKKFSAAGFSVFSAVCSRFRRAMRRKTRRESMGKYPEISKELAAAAVPTLDTE